MLAVPGISRFAERITVNVGRVEDPLKRRQMGVCPESMNKALSPGRRGEGLRSYCRF
jgi:hypothetical protein